MKKLIVSIAAAVLLTAVFLVVFWSKSCNGTDNDASVSDHTEPDGTADVSVISFISEDLSDIGSIEDNVQKNDSIGELFSPYKELIDSGVYKLELVRQRRFGGNSMPVKTITYYGDGFVNIIEEEGHGIASETFIDESGTYCFDSSSSIVYLMTDLTVTPDTLITDGLCFIETGTATVGTSLFTYERYKTADGQTLDYLFAGTALKRMKLYSKNDYELIGVELSDDISEARRYIPENYIIIES